MDWAILRLAQHSIAGTGAELGNNCKTNVEKLSELSHTHTKWDWDSHSKQWKNLRVKFFYCQEIQEVTSHTSHNPAISMMYNSPLPVPPKKDFKNSQFWYFLVAQHLWPCKANKMQLLQSQAQFCHKYGPECLSNNIFSFKHFSSRGLQ